MSVKELKEIYENGFILEFDDNDKIVFISDVHRGDGTYSDSLLPNRNPFSYISVNSFTDIITSI